MERLVITLSLLVLATLTPRTVCAEELPVCSGYNPRTDRWDAVGPRPGRAEDYCPPSTVFFAIYDRPGSRYPKVSSAPFSGSCCPVPADLLLDEHAFVAERCPDGYVITGGRSSPEEGGAAARYQMRCTKIDAERYRFTTETHGWAVGWHSEYFDELLHHAVGNRTRFTLRARMPVALRYGLLRLSQRSWDSGGCVGSPWGSVMTARLGHSCEETRFRQLVRLGGDETPLRLYPECDSIDSEFSPQPVCIQNSAP